jgi:hypothetical protein
MLVTNCRFVLEARFASGRQEEIRTQHGGLKKEGKMLKRRPAQRQRSRVKIEMWVATSEGFAMNKKAWRSGEILSVMKSKVCLRDRQ